MPSSASMHRLTVVLAAVFALAAASAGSAAAAPAAVGCTGSENATFTPGLTNTPKPTNATFSARYSCISPTDPDIRSATITQNPVATASCAVLTTNATRTRTIVWNTGETSAYTFSTSITAVPGTNYLTNVRTGSITAGKFLGARTHELVLTTVDQSPCSTPAGVPGFTSRNLLTITAT